MTHPQILILNATSLPDLDEADSNSYLDKIEQDCTEISAELGLSVNFSRANSAEKLYQTILDQGEKHDALIINPGSFAEQSSDAAKSNRQLEDKLSQLDLTVIEVHLSNFFHAQNDNFKPLSGNANKTGLICGLGVPGYLLAIRAAHKKLSQQVAA